VRDGERAAAEHDAMGAAYLGHSDDSPYNAYYELPAMISLLGDVTGRRVLDVGCGLGEAIAAAGFLIKALVEPRPVASLRERDPATGCAGAPSAVRPGGRL
jgi:SAM-dependent methyltransferase